VEAATARRRRCEREEVEERLRETVRLTKRQGRRRQ
jgi:hypothetical protein